MVNHNICVHLNRRQYLKWAGVGGIAALAGCAGGTDDDSDGTPEETDSGGTETEEEVRMGGHLRIGFSLLPQSLHPMEGTNTGDIVLRTAAYSRLARVDRNLEPIPDLATEWGSNDANDEWTFTLREDAMFSNTGGLNVLAEDIKATVEMVMENPDSAAANNLGAYDSIEIEDDYRFTINLKESDLKYPKKITEADSRFVILPKNIIEDRREEIGETDFGTGPFVVDEYNEGSSLTLTKNDDYYLSDEDGNNLPYVDQVTWKLISDPTAQLNALLDERIDTLQLTPTSQMEQLRQTDSVDTIERSSTSFISFVLNETVETDSGEMPFADPKVRKAMKHATDLEQMVAAADEKLGIMQHGPTTPAHQFYPDFDPGLEFGTTAQPEEAQRLLEEAGYDDGLELPTMYYSAGEAPSREPTSIVFKEQMAAVGIEFEIQRLSDDVWLSDYWNQDGVWYSSGWAGRLLDSTVHDLALHSDAPWNSARWTNEDYDAAYKRMKGAQSFEEYADALADAQRIHHLDGGWIIPGAEIIMSAANSYIRNVKPFPTEIIDYHYNDWLTEDAPEA
jgi:peptide/nickel transport system substrate-binding protein